MTDIHRDNTTQPTAPAPTPDSMGSRMMWVMMLGCCLAIPLALIVGGVSIGGIAGVSPWLLGIGAVLVIALVTTRRISGGPRCETPPEHPRDEAETVLDPVCGMRIDRNRAAGTRRLGRGTLHFCCDICIGRFDADPTLFSGGRRTRPLRAAGR